MPELPDVEAFKRTVDATALHQRVERVSVTDDRALGKTSRKSLQRKLKGRRFTSTCRRGKYLFLATDGSPVLVLHFGMTGYPEYGSEEESEPQHSRLVVHFDNGYRLAYVCQRMLGRVDLATDAEGFLTEMGIGPDAMGISREEFISRLEGRRGAVKSALMNQGTVAGLGNIYCDEVLFQAGVHPKTQRRDLSHSTLARLHSVMRRVLRTAIRRNSDVDRLPASYLIPRREAGESCPKCGTRIRRMKVNQRGTYYCPRCQRKK